MADTAQQGRHTRVPALSEYHLPSRRRLRAVLGRGRWTLRDYAEAYSLSERQARRRIAALEELGRIIRLEQPRYRTDDDGNRLRGRPALQWRVDIAQ